MTQYHAHFGFSATPDVPTELKQDYDQLTNPLVDGAYAKTVGYGNATPRQRLALQRILDLGRRDLLEAIAASPSPEGRMYAVEALCPEDADWADAGGACTRTMSKIAELQAAVRVCWGDICFQEPISSVPDGRDLIVRVSRR